MIRVYHLNFFIKNAIPSAMMVGMVMFYINPALAQDFRGTPYQSLDRTHTVRERVHPDYEARGIHRGAFVIKPSVEMGGAYNDNIFAVSNNETGDFITTVAPHLRLQNLPSTRHGLIVDLSSKHGVYGDNSNENYNDYTARVAPRLNVTKALTIDADFIFNHAHEDRTSPNVSQTLADPLTYDRLHTGVSATYKPGLMAMTVGGSWEQYGFDNTAQIGGGQVIQDDRNRDEYRGFAELAYEFRPHYEAFIRTGINTIAYDRNDFVAGPNTYSGNNRDSSGYDVLTGVRFDITSLMRADLGVGYLSQHYDQAGLPDVNGVNLHANLAWNVTPLTTINANVDRLVKETISTGSSGYLETAIGAGVDHELRRNVIVSAHANYAIQDYKGTAQKDDVFGFSTGVTYKMNRNINIVLEYLHDQRQSNQAALDYARNVIMLRTKFKF